MVDVLLDVGAVTETVEVVASVAGVQTEIATVGRTVEAQQIDKLILNGRNPALLALLKPGVRRGSLDGGPYPSSSTGPIYQVGDNLSVIKGNHTIKFGVLWSRQGQNDFDQINVSGVPGGTNNKNGRFAFTDGRPDGTGLAVSNAAMGLFST